MTTATAATSAPATGNTRGRDTVGVPRLLRAELRWIFRRPRTLVVLGLLAVIPIVLGLGLTLVDTTASGGGGDGREGGGAGANLLVSAAGNALVLPIAALMLTITLLLPLVAAMASADALAGETAHGTLRGWLLAPVSRGRLLTVKALGVAAVVLASVLLMSLTGIVTGLVINGSGSLFTLSGSTLSFGAALLKVALAAGWVALQLCAVGAIALAISAGTEHPMLVVASVLAGTIVFSILGILDSLSWLHPFLLTESWPAISDVLRDPVPGGDLAEGAVRAFCYIVIGLSIAYARLTTKDG
ncbi:hypothetical protein CFN78_09080 [Amycolatopsis antarctica]|uniref:ABC transporter permease n=1 Tax=Amycolatopsis antarctica TaxID=1854586 RepID=A0A263D584_9PSEU|nr:ABC transporter permease subunit [Amycolatopsis antarctica]OZM73664.1 hypothetical protein CFN78_09080 [Amycolatopsis antarctica]